MVKAYRFRFHISLSNQLTKSFFVQLHSGQLPPTIPKVHNVRESAKFVSLVLKLAGFIKSGWLCCYNAEVESRTQDSRPRTQKNPRPRTKDTNASVLQKKGLQKFFSGDLQKKKKRSSKKFSAHLQNFNHSKNSAVLEPRIGQFLST